jgi:hypothetical protein
VVTGCPHATMMLQYVPERFELVASCADCEAVQATLAKHDMYLDLAALTAWCEQVGVDERLAKRVLPWAPLRASER